jgi:hypothetical protein
MVSYFIIIMMIIIIIYKNIVQTACFVGPTCSAIA